MRKSAEFRGGKLLSTKMVKGDWSTRLEGVSVRIGTLGDLSAEFIEKDGNKNGTIFYTGLPPVFFSASDTEVLLDDSKMLYQKLKAQGHQTGLDIQHGVCHAFQVFTGMPEARKVLSTVFAFLEEIS